MENNVYQEYKQTIHFNNRAGVRATCSDCHVPDPWVHKVVRKIQASNEVLHKLLGSIDTPEKFDAKRLKLAKNVWRTMKETDSRECRNCHDFNTMNPENQKPRARKQHLFAMESGNTCIDCHKAIAHKKVHDQLTDEEIDALEKPDPSIIRPMAAQWIAFQEQENAPAAVAEAVPAVMQTTAETAPAVATPAVASSNTTAAATPASVASSSPAGNSGINWGAISGRQVKVFYPGQSSMEWILGREHGGKRAYQSGDRCFDCHEKEIDEIGRKIVTGEKEAKVGNEQENMEPTLIPGKRGSFPVQVQAAYDGDQLHLRFQWPDAEHTPAPFVDGGKMDPNNQVKLAVMLATDEVEHADRAGCWGTCHVDLRSMPFAPEASAIAATSLQHATDGVTKYIGESRSEINMKTRKGALGGWDKLKAESEIDAELQAGHYMDLIRYKAGEKVSENGHVLDERVPDDGVGIEATGTLNNGVWTVELSRPLNSDKPGDLKLDTSATYNIGFAIHDDFTNARYHHVSLGYKLGFDNGVAEINAVKQ
jgi:nitrate/TMAO reductase-like tetraheme cytochrome c subunit